MTNKLTDFQQSLVDAADEYYRRKYSELIMHEAKAKFLALVERAVPQEEIDWYRHQLDLKGTHGGIIGD